jgi:hypothetical protein
MIYPEKKAFYFLMQKCVKKSTLHNQKQKEENPLSFKDFFVR